MKGKVSIIVPVHNEEKRIENCLNSILSQQDFESLVDEVIVVDDFSTDNTVKILEKYKNKIMLVKNKKNLGIAKSLNSGFMAAKSEYVCSIHADCVIPKTWIENQMKCFSGNIAIVTSMVVVPKEFLEKFNLWNRIFYSKFTVPRKIYRETKCHIFRKSIIEKFGYFSGDFRVAGEDFDLFSKIENGGYKVYCSDMIAKNMVGFHNIDFWKYFRKELQYGEARGAILRRHGSFILFNPFAFRPWPDLRLVVALPLVIVLRTLVHFVGFWKGFLTGKQEW